MGEFFPTLLALAQQLVRASADEVAAAGTALYVALFTHFSGAYHHQVGASLTATAVCLGLLTRRPGLAAMAAKGPSLVCHSLSKPHVGLKRDRFRYMAGSIQPVFQQHK